MKSLYKIILILSFISSPVKGEFIKNFNRKNHDSVINFTQKDGETYQTGKASYYGGNNHHGRKTASGKVFDKNGMTCAHMTLPFGTKLKVTNIKTGVSVIVTVTDRGNFGKLGRIIDLSEGAFKKIAPLKQGVVKVKIEKV